MNASDAAYRLCWYGVLLFLLGLINGALVSQFANPRMGLSAHLAGVQNGMVLLLFGLLWPRLSLSQARGRLAEGLSLASMYAIWLALALAGVFGTSAATPIAGAGFRGLAWQEFLVTALLYAGSAAIVVAAVLVLVGLGRPGGARS